MSRMITAVLATLAIASTVSAQTIRSKGASAPKGQPYEVEFVFDTTAYSGIMTLQIARKGGPVAGAMTIDRPTRVTGDVAGTLKGDELALDYSFTMVEENCTGRVVVTARMSEKRDSAQGTATASGCGDSTVEGTFTLKKTAQGSATTR